ncbi:hypothetical protein BDW22DRAFT_90815 [Trametopsis cervina]|nr:hypothetical protein BDW22DRAFT_90815 [Trametopsis cervina]
MTQTLLWVLRVQAMSMFIDMLSVECVPLAFPLRCFSFWSMRHVQESTQTAPLKIYSSIYIYVCILLGVCILLIYWCVHQRVRRCTARPDRPWNRLQRTGTPCSGLEQLETDWNAAATGACTSTHILFLAFRIDICTVLVSSKYCTALYCIASRVVLEKLRRVVFAISSALGMYAVGARDRVVVWYCREALLFSLVCLLHHTQSPYSGPRI